MGFDWSIDVSVAFSQPIALPPNVSYWYLLKKFANYEPCESGSKRARGRAAELVARDSDKHDDEEVEGGIGRSCTEVETRFHYNPKLGGAAEDKEFNLECNWPELLSEAFAEAAEKICGPGHGVELRLERGGAHGEAEGGAAESMLLLRYAPSRTCAGTGEGEVDIGRGGVNVPWGVVRAPLPRINEGAVAARFNSVLTALGLEAGAPPAWALISVAFGG